MVQWRPQIHMTDDYLCYVINLAKQVMATNSDQNCVAPAQPLPTALPQTAMICSGPTVCNCNSQTFTFARKTYP